MSIESLRTSLKLLDTTPGAQSLFNVPQRMIYHRMAQDVMLIQGMHYAVEEALASVGELGSPDPPHDPRSRCLLRLQQNLIDIARILENVQERTVHNITSHASTPQAPILVDEEQTPQPIIGSSGSNHLPTPPTPVRSYIQDSAELVMFHPEPLPHRSDLNAVTPGSFRKFDAFYSSSPRPRFQTQSIRRRR